MPLIYFKKGFSMNIKELKAEIRDLGYEEDATISEYSDIVYSSINRSIKTVSETVRAKTERVSIFQSGCTNNIEDANIEFENSYMVSVKGRSYCFFCTGAGTYSINGKTFQLDAEDGFYSGEINGESLFSWQVNGICQLHGFSVYNSEIKPVRPYYENVRHILPNYMKKTSIFGGIHKNKIDVMCMGEAPHIEKGHDFIDVPRNFKGTIVVECELIPPKITRDTPNETEIPLDNDLHVLIPLLASYYIWLDDEERKAVMYFNKYEELRDKILENSKSKPLGYIGGGFR